MTDPDLQRMLAGLWAEHAHLAEGRVAALEAYSTALSAGGDDPERRRLAEWEAHKLAGALGSYGRPGSDRAAALERLLQGEPDPAAVARLVAELRVLVTG